MTEAQAIKAVLAAVTTHTSDVLFAATLPRNHAQRCVCVTVTHTSIQRACWVTVTGYEMKEKTCLCGAEDIGKLERQNNALPLFISSAEPAKGSLKPTLIDGDFQK